MILGSRCTDQRIYALAGVAQCAAIVDELAANGQSDEQMVAACIEAFFLRNADETRIFFEEHSKVDLGLQQLSILFSNSSSPERTRQIGYTFQMIHLSKQMARRLDMLGVISAGIDRLEMQKQSLSDSELQEAIGELYQKTISKLSFRIQVQGQHGYLRQTQTANTIRAILFCGIRFAHLWRQMGGSQLDFLLRKSQIKAISERLSHNHQ